MSDHVLLSLGHGYTASVLARPLIDRGWRVVGTTRSEARADRIRRTGVEPVIWPGSDLSPVLSRASHLLSSIGPDEAGDPVLRDLGPVIAERAVDLDWAGYLSTTGVYGDRAGDWVDENSATRPSTARGARRLAAERAWQAIPSLPLHIFRLAGIYGPERTPFDRVRRPDSRRVIKDGQVFSRIHVEDIARVLLASIDRPNPGAIYNVCDDEPAPPQDILEYAADLLDIPAPPEVAFEDADLSAMARSFYSDSKRVSNRRIRDELGVELKYPSYREGLVALLAEEQGRR